MANPRRMFGYFTPGRSSKSGGPAPKTPQDARTDQLSPQLPGQAQLDRFMDTRNEYLHWCTEKRIKMSPGAMNPIEYGNGLGFGGCDSARKRLALCRVGLASLTLVIS